MGCDEIRIRYAIYIRNITRDIVVLGINSGIYSA
jgi:hypothetical protein